MFARLDKPRRFSDSDFWPVGRRCDGTLFLEYWVSLGFRRRLPADSMEDRTISTFSRSELPHFAGINTFMGFPYLEDVRQVGDFDVAILGASFDMRRRMGRGRASGRRRYAGSPACTRPTA